ncbi:aldo/keto reductase [Calothrix sp. FACHB-1219]|uniref:aldo/keto reductase n=1 Tax=unclassified Calothrix TaxID=2619626 RepID=UPI0016881549|nr:MULTISPECIES: aldo/keto reductase [unclassified Calothrix]MBD2206541.1 aldo/keto reductase [Calothrix sp. FACHB-168]MBD2221337.1 aldo/keto reductase [Calothrix sp. FACHB-1219]
MEIVTKQGKKASILGLAAQSQLDATSISLAFVAGINYFFFYSLESENFLDGLKSLLKDKREQVLVATGSENRDINALRRYLDSVRHRLDVDSLDVFFVEYVFPGDDSKQIQALLAELRSQQEKGTIRYVGVTTHNRPIAVELIQQQQCDILMHRYNMAHRKAETDVLPTAQQANIPVVAFTCTRWGSLLSKHPTSEMEPPTAADCYRYALNHPAVTVALTAPKTPQELQANLSVLNAPPLSPKEVARWREYGDLIYGTGQDAFDTQWV